MQIILKSNEFDNENPLGNYYSSYEGTSNQLRVIKSSNIIEKVVQRLKLNVSYFVVGRIKTTEVYQDMPFTVHSDNFGAAAYGQLFGFKIIDSKSYLLTYMEGDQQIEKKFAFGELISDNELYFIIDKNISLNESRAKSFSKYDYQFKIWHDTQLIDKYKSSIEIKNEEWTSILLVSLKDEIPERAISFLDTLSKVYIEYSLQNRVDINENSFNYINRQLDEVVGIINRIENEMESYKASKSILNIEREEEDYFKRLVDIETKLNNAEMKLSSVTDLKKYILQTSDDKFVPPSFYLLNEDEFIQNSINQLYEFQMKKNELLEEGTEKNFSTSSTEKKVEQVKKNLLNHLNNTEAYIRASILSIKDEIQGYEGKLKVIPQRQRDLLNIQRKLEVNEKLYLYLLQKRAENVISRAAILPETKVIEKPRSAGIIWPNRMDIFLSYVGIAFGIAFVIALLRTLFLDKIETVDELSSLTDMTILGSIPLTEKNTEGSYLVVENQPKGMVTEAFRNIRANLQYLSIDKDNEPKVVLVTSIHPGEGKTFNSVNTASILAKAGKKVIVVDFDMHKPRVHKAFNMEKDIGLSNFLINKLTLEQVILKTQIENLDVILAGPIPPNASELVLSEKVNELLEDLKKKYDYVILDTPPLALISDAISIMKYSSIVLFVMHTSHAKRNGLRFLKEIQVKNPDNSMAIILNSVRVKRFRYYYGKYSYNYGYGYNYGYNYSYSDPVEIKDT